MEYKAPAKGILTLVGKIIEQNQTIIDINKSLIHTFSAVPYIFDPELLSKDEFDVLMGKKDA